jgi:hypothetical protein
MKRENKIRKLLGNKYHLSISYEPDMEHYHWVLFKKYDDPFIYYCDANKEIMSSDKNTEDELYEFAKAHHEIDEHRFMSILNIIMTWIAFILMIVNIFIKDTTIRGFAYGIDFMVVIYVVISYKIQMKNIKVKWLNKTEPLRTWLRGDE